MIASEMPKRHVRPVKILVASFSSRLVVISIVQLFPALFNALLGLSESVVVTSPKHVPTPRPVPKPAGGIISDVIDLQWVRAVQPRHPISNIQAISIRSCPKNIFVDPLCTAKARLIEPHQPPCCSQSTAESNSPPPAVCCPPRS